MKGRSVGVNVGLDLTITPRYDIMSSMKKFRIFLSSVQSEFAAERRMLAEYIRTDALLGRFFDVFLFEETVAPTTIPSQVSPCTGRVIANRSSRLSRGPAICRVRVFSCRGKPRCHSVEGNVPVEL